MQSTVALRSKCLEYRTANREAAKQDVQVEGVEPPPEQRASQYGGCHGAFVGELKAELNRTAAAWRWRDGAAIEEYERPEDERCEWKVGVECERNHRKHGEPQPNVHKRCDERRDRWTNGCVPQGEHI